MEIIIKNSCILVIYVIVSSIIPIVLTISFCVFLIKKFNLMQVIITYCQSNPNIITVMGIILAILALFGIGFRFRDTLRILFCFFTLLIPSLCIDFFIKKNLKVLYYNKLGISIKGNDV